MTSVVHARSARESVKSSSGLAQFFFLRTTTELLRETIAADKSETDSIKQELSLIEPGHLYIHRQKNGCYFGCYDNISKTESAITGNPERVYSLARRRYLECRLHAIEHTMHHFEAILEELESIREDSLRKARLNRFCSVGLDLTRILFSKEQNEWLDEVYTPNPFNRDSLRYPTEAGTLTRSKSEAKIGSILESIGLPYRYDDLVEIKSSHRSSAPFRDTYFADFKVPNLSGGITIHEHLGAFQIDQYPDNSLKRLNDYHCFTVHELTGRPVEYNEFTWSFESDLQDQRLFKRMIHRMLLPGYPV